MSFEISNKKDKTRHNYRYSFNISLPLCKTVYLKLCNLNDYKLSTLQNHYQENGLTERIHRNTGHASRRNSRVFVDFNITSSIKQYLTQYGIINGLPSPMRHRNDSRNFIYLPTGENYMIAQNVTIPYSPQQVGSIYFKSTFAVHLFGVCKTEDGLNRQINFIIAENEFPKGVSKGANTTLNMVYHAIKIFAKDGKKDLRITCDNCIAQNKNNLSLFFWCWLSILGWYDSITVNFMIPGHMKFICDAFFKLIKKTYRNQNINTVDDIKNIVNMSSTSNEGIRYKGGIEWKCAEICHKLLRNNNFDVNEKLDILDIVDISEERKKYLHQKIRQHVEDPYKDIYYL
ncbi:hypothetical protein GLOIN_2v1884495 [Rhizophagus clarus]|uniref:DUF7869 domain-containing protein n=1 Tax=Rhizophagus clarus TaxID=94130 RepID=A0A8H3LMJ9_9GLOM|nr:hypothetical protein GLOIN_2v1884495 [Rhizophagus clarus]